MLAEPWRGCFEAGSKMTETKSIENLVAQARAHMEQQQWAEAVPPLNAALYQQPNDPYHALLLGTCYYELRDAEKAMGCFKLAAQNLPDHPLPLCSQADVLMLIGEYDQAGMLYRRVLARFPESELAQQSLAWWQEETAKRQPQAEQ